jgi:phospholipid-translocating ATPase
LTTLSQFVPFLKVGLIVTYVAPLVFVLIVTMCKEAWDDIKRLIRDKDMNMAKFEKLSKPTSKNPSNF